MLFGLLDDGTRGRLPKRGGPRPRRFTSGAVTCPLEIDSMLSEKISLLSVLQFSLHALVSGNLAIAPKVFRLEK